MAVAEAVAAEGSPAQLKRRRSVWVRRRAGARAYLSCMMPGFPNLWSIYGPNTNGALTPNAFHEMVTLQQFIPVCPVCKKSLADQTAQSALETYLQTHPNAKFHYTVCSSCSKQ